MRRAIALLFALCLFAVPAFAADAPASVAGSLAWQDGKETGRTWKADFDLNFPIASHLSIGPLLRAQYYSSEYGVDPDGGSATLWSVGGSLTVYTTESHNGFSFGAAATAPMGEFGSGYLLEPFVQLELGGDAAFFRARYSHPLQMSEDHDTIDLERNEVTAGFGLRF